MTESINIRLQRIRRENYNHLNGVEIYLAMAEKKYSVSRRTLTRWVEHGYVKKTQAGYRYFVDEADLAYCADIHHIRRSYGVTSVPLLNDDGSPYLMVFPDVAAYRRKRRAKSDK